ncbi:MAG: hypothetical protein ACREC9_02440 [Methylocella sp.]
MTMKLGYAVSSAIFFTIFIVTVVAQVAAKGSHPFLYWAVIVATTTAGTTIADFADRSLGIGYAGGASILFVLLMAALGVWYWSAGSVSVDTITSPKVEMFYWGTILFSQYFNEMRRLTGPALIAAVLCHALFGGMLPLSHSSIRGREARGSQVPVSRDLAGRGLALKVPYPERRLRATAASRS